MSDSEQLYKDQTKVLKRQSPDSTKIHSRVSELHYKHKLTHQQIAELLGTSRIKITRLLAESLENGTVEINIKDAPSLFLETEKGLNQTFGLVQSWVVPSILQSKIQQNSLSLAATDALNISLTNETTVAVGSGKTIMEVSQNFKIKQNINCTFLSTVGIIPDHNLHFNAHSTAEMFAQYSNNSSNSIPAPFAAHDARLMKMLMKDPSISQPLAQAAGADIFIASIGNISNHSFLVEAKLLSTTELQAIKLSGAVGDVLGRFFDNSGSLIDSSFNQRIIGLTLEEIKNIPVRIGVASGKSKRNAILSALKGGIFNQLVTDNQTGLWLIDQHK